MEATIKALGLALDNSDAMALVAALVVLILFGDAGRLIADRIQSLFERRK